MKLIYPALTTILSLTLLSATSRADEVALYDNTHLEAKAPPFVPADAPPPFFIEGDVHGAIQFYSGDADNVSSISTTLKRTGTPGGKIIFEVWNVDEEGNPGESVGVLGETDVDSLPLELGLVTVNGSVKGLTPMTRYYLVFRLEPVNLQPEGPPTQTIHVAPLFKGDWEWTGPGTAHPPEGPPLEELLSFSNGKWETLSSQLGIPLQGWQHARITAACPEPDSPVKIDAEIEPAVAISWNSQTGKHYEIQSSTDLENWVVEAEGIEGTGETSTYFFLRTTSEIYYRVAEAQ